ncbi:helix-turn-helix transcriptional regulator [Klebsiella pneumoniae]|uniref:helix-turn-helix transcriptional regulator n=1 Tax=Klebsiella pneumoniae TaxID=573 RepID=UPI0007CC0D80|nr:AraC family transcriptional regulator [Klebsiella pneumoniae]SAV16692.1 AraC/XylS family transcriptional regulator [Klebsiella pneumoniae]
MNIQTVERTAPSVDELLNELLTLVRSRIPLPCDCLRAEQTHQVKKFEVEGATLSFPLEGEFRYREMDEWQQVHPGELLIIPNARSIDIEYTPSRHSGEFVALSVVLSEEQLEAARLLLAAPPPKGTGSIAAIPVSSLLSPLSRWTSAMREGKRSLSLHAMVEVVLCLYDMGHHALLRSRQPSLAMKIRQMVSEKPAHHWSAAEIEEQLGMSGPTLRRHLASESTSLRAVVADARIAEGLRLLMTTTLPVKTIAGRVGYTSVASFSRQFSERYGTEPSGFR